MSRESLMDAMIEKEAAEALLDRGVSVPFKELRIPFMKKPLKLRVTMRRPTLGGIIGISRIYRKMGVTAEEMRGWTVGRRMRFMAEHGCDLSLVMAHTVCRGRLLQPLLLRPAAWIIRNFVEYRYLLVAVEQFESLMGTDPFMPIIRSADRTNPMKPRLSR